MRPMILSVSIFMMTACGGAPISSDPIDQEPIDMPMENPMEMPMEQPNDPPQGIDIGGVWGLKTVIGQILSSPLGDGPATITMRSLVTVEHSATSATMSTKVCAVELSPFQNATTTYPQATIDAMSAEGIRIELDDDKFEVPAQPQLLGWRAGDNPMTEEIPANDRDPRVFDVERDGHPGATVSVESPFATGDVYVVNRTIQALSGTIASEDRIEGRASVDMQQKIVGASEVLLTLGSVESRPDTDPSVNVFNMIRLDARADCNAVIRGL